MARRKESGFEAVASLPWQAGIVLGLIGYVLIQYGPVWFLGSSTNPVFAAFAKVAAKGVYQPIAWVVLALCWFAAFISYRRNRHRRRLLDTRTDLESLAANGWRNFELLVGEAFRRQGYSVEESGLGGPDGGIDLILRKDGRRLLVQCKQWKHRQVGVSTVREMYGLLAHHQAHAVKIVSIGNYTVDARRFAQGKPIELVSGEELLRMIRAVQHTPISAIPSTSIRPAPAPTAPAPIAATKTPTQPASESDTAPACPSCGKTMITRRNRRSGASFWGCTGYPSCRGTRESAL
jgi:restriction system protein